MILRCEVCIVFWTCRQNLPCTFKEPHAPFNHRDIVSETKSTTTFIYNWRRQKSLFFFLFEITFFNHFDHFLGWNNFCWTIPWKAPVCTMIYFPICFSRGPWIWRSLYTLDKFLLLLSGTIINHLSWKLLLSTHSGKNSFKLF